MKSCSKFQRLFAPGLAAIMSTAAMAVTAMDYPGKLVRIIVPFTAGGPNDATIRPLAQKLQELLGQPFVVDYRPGANGLIGAEYVSKSPPDGYTLLIISSSYTISTAMYAKLPYDPLRDLTAVSSIATSDIVFVNNLVVPARNAQEFVALARSKPGKLVYGSSGVGGSLHLAGELLSYTTGIQMSHVPYKGAIQALTDVIGGHLDAMFVAAPAAVPMVKGGKVRALGVASRRRAPLLPEVPTFAEAGFPAVVVDSRYGLLAPGPTPRDIIARLNVAIVKALSLPDVRERYAAMGMEAVSASPQEYSEHLRNEMVRLRKIVITAKIPPL